MSKEVESKQHAVEKAQMALKRERIMVGNEMHKARRVVDTLE